MDIKLDAPYKDKIDNNTQSIIQEFILNNINEYKNNSSKLTELTIEAVSALGTSKSRVDYMKNQGFFKNLFATISGENKRGRSEIDYNYMIIKNASIKMIEYLANQNKITYEGLIYINNKLNNIESNIDEELINICNNIRDSFNIILNKINDSKNKIYSLENKLKLLELKSIINILEYNNKKYNSMDIIEKIICLSNDLFSKVCYTNDNKISKEDIDIIKAISNDLSIDIEEKINISNIYKKLIENNNLINKFFNNISYNDTIPAHIIPISSAIKKLEKLNSEENYIVSSILKETNKKSEDEIKINLIIEFGINISNFNYNMEISAYDIIILIINELKMISDYINVPITIININDKIIKIKNYYNSKAYIKTIIECDKFLNKIDKQNKEVKQIKKSCLYKLLLKETKEYNDKAKIYLIQKDYDNAFKYFTKYIENYAHNKEIKNIKTKLKKEHNKIIQHKNKIEEKLKKETNLEKKEYLEFINDFWCYYLSKI